MAKIKIYNISGSVQRKTSVKVRLCKSPNCYSVAMVKWAMRSPYNRSSVRGSQCLARKTDHSIYDLLIRISCKYFCRKKNFFLAI